eukprot:scaffold7352_cov254-Pinguiococcus_pyrenoidosus.AAC.22
MWDPQQSGGDPRPRPNLCHRAEAGDQRPRYPGRQLPSDLLLSASSLLFGSHLVWHSRPGYPQIREGPRHHPRALCFYLGIYR